MNEHFEVRIAVERDFDQIHMADLSIKPEILRTKIGRNEVIVCDESGHITGVLRFQWFWDYLPFINYIWVEEGFRDEHRASRMIEKLEATTEGRNYKRIMASTQSNETAQNFFRKVGFQYAGGFAMSDQPFELIMIKYLN
ncbi:MAG: GNAT family N-acetyltransferase [Opitutaceae bacterium]